MIHHHPDEELLLAHAGGHLGRGAALLVDVHLEGCLHCRGRLQQYEALGGALLEGEEPALMEPDALARTLARIDSTPPPPARAPQPRRPAAPIDWPAGVPWPRALERCDVSRWSWMGPGMRWTRLTLREDPAARLFLLRIGAGRSLARHTHSANELTQVLCGAFDDGRAIFASGDFDSADGLIHHQPAVLPGSECICLASVEGPLRFDGRIAAFVGGLIGM
ncbi:ChrR family anti-sigma-E factor [Ideonella sp. YS5]|uniref:ChrR family anti-sigma-E factor n=1 Tax=Ideonella sp. YS5 TaxID=3453714 RepID=UPI003EED5E14